MEGACHTITVSCDWQPVISASSGFRRCLNQSGHNQATSVVITDEGVEITRSIDSLEGITE